MVLNDSNTSSMSMIHSIIFTVAYYYKSNDNEVLLLSSLLVATPGFLYQKCSELKTI